MKYLKNPVFTISKSNIGPSDHNVRGFKSNDQTDETGEGSQLPRNLAAMWIEG